MPVRQNSAVGTTGETVCTITCFVNAGNFLLTCLRKEQVFFILFKSKFPALTSFGVEISVHSYNSTISSDWCQIFLQ